MAANLNIKVLLEFFGVDTVDELVQRIESLGDENPIIEINPQVAKIIDEAKADAASVEQSFKDAAASAAKATAETEKQASNAKKAAAPSEAPDLPVQDQNFKKLQEDGQAALQNVRQLRAEVEGLNKVRSRALTIGEQIALNEREIAELVATESPALEVDTQRLERKNNALRRLLKTTNSVAVKQIDAVKSTREQAQANLDAARAAGENEAELDRLQAALKSIDQSLEGQRLRKHTQALKDQRQAAKQGRKELEAQAEALVANAREAARAATGVERLVNESNRLKDSAASLEENAQLLRENANSANKLGTDVDALTDEYERNAAEARKQADALDQQAAQQRQATREARDNLRAEIKRQKALGGSQQLVKRLTSEEQKLTAALQRAENATIKQEAAQARANKRLAEGGFALKNVFNPNMREAKIVTDIFQAALINTRAGNEAFNAAQRASASGVNLLTTSLLAGIVGFQIIKAVIGDTKDESDLLAEGLTEQAKSVDSAADSFDSYGAQLDSLVGKNTALSDASEALSETLGITALNADDLARSFSLENIEATAKGAARGLGSLVREASDFLPLSRDITNQDRRQAELRSLNADIRVRNREITKDIAKEVRRQNDELKSTEQIQANLNVLAGNLAKTKFRELDAVENLNKLEHDRLVTLDAIGKEFEDLRRNLEAEAKLRKSIRDGQEDEVEARKLLLLRQQLDNEESERWLALMKARGADAKEFASFRQREFDRISEIADVETIALGTAKRRLAILERRSGENKATLTQLREQAELVKELEKREAIASAARIKARQELEKAVTQVQVDRIKAAQAELKDQQKIADQQKKTLADLEALTKKDIRSTKDRIAAETKINELQDRRKELLDSESATLEDIAKVNKELGDEIEDSIVDFEQIISELKNAVKDAIEEGDVALAKELTDEFKKQLSVLDALNALAFEFQKNTGIDVAEAAAKALEARVKRVEAALIEANQRGQGALANIRGQVTQEDALAEVRRQREAEVRQQQQQLLDERLSQLAPGSRITDRGEVIGADGRRDRRATRELQRELSDIRRSIFRAPVEAAELQKAGNKLASDLIDKFTEQAQLTGDNAAALKQANETIAKEAQASADLSTAIKDLTSAVKNNDPGKLADQLQQQNQQQNTQLDVLEGGDGPALPPPDPAANFFGPQPQPQPLANGPQQQSVSAVGNAVQGASNALSASKDATVAALKGFGDLSSATAQVASEAFDASLRSLSFSQDIFARLQNNVQNSKQLLKLPKV